MIAANFALDARLAADTSPVVSLPLCDVLLMNDARYPWLVLVPRRAGLVEIIDLDGAEQAMLWQEVNKAGAALRSVAPCDKLNLGVLGNIVRQLHVHIVVRREGDEAWPGPVWGNGESVPYATDDLETVTQSVKRALAIGNHLYRSRKLPWPDGRLYQGRGRRDLHRGFPNKRSIETASLSANAADSDQSHHYWPLSLSANQADPSARDDPPARGPWFPAD